MSGALPFSEIVRELIADGMKYYHVDYVAIQMHYYSVDDTVVVVPLNFEGLPVMAETFDAPALKVAILDSQRHGQKFGDFSRRAAEAGVACHFAFLREERVTHLGRQGDLHIEWFPGAGGGRWGNDKIIPTYC